jgi:hypothetical protein
MPIMRREVVAKNAVEGQNSRDSRVDELCLLSILVDLSGVGSSARFAHNAERNPLLEQCGSE